MSSSQNNNNNNNKKMKYTNNNTNNTNSNPKSNNNNNYLKQQQQSNITTSMKTDEKQQQLGNFDLSVGGDVNHNNNHNHNSYSIVPPIDHTTATADQIYVHTLKQEISRLRRKLDEVLDSNADILRAKASHIEEKINLQKELAESDAEIQSLKSKVLLNSQSLKSELHQKIDELKSINELYDQEKQEKIKLSHQNLSYESEIAQLKSSVVIHEEQATKHNAEMANLREIINNMTKELSSKKGQLQENESVTFEYKTEKKGLQDTVIQLERRISEYIEREEFLSNDNTRMANTITQQQENYEQLNQLLNQMKGNMSNLKEQRDSELSRANSSEDRLVELTRTCNELQQKKTEMEERIINVEKQNKALILELKNAQKSFIDLKEGKAMLSSKVDLLEKEKVTLVLEQIGYAKEIDSLKQELESSSNSYNQMMSKMEQEIKNKQAIQTANACIESDLQKLKDDNEELLESLNNLNKQLKEAERMKDDINEIHRKQQSESSLRISEYTAKNTELYSEVIRLKEEISASSANRSSEYIQWDSERTELKSQASESRQKLLSITDQNEELNVKLESLNSEVIELKEKLKKESTNHIQDITMLEEQKTREIESVKSKLKEVHTLEINKLNQNHSKEIDKKCDELLSMTTQSYEKQIKQHSMKIHELGNELTQMTAKFEELQLLLKAESEKYMYTLQQLKDMRKFSEETTNKLQEKVKQLEKEKIQLKSRNDAEIEDLKEQINAYVESVKRKDQNIELFRQQINSEKDQRFVLSQKIIELEDKQSKYKLAEESESQRIQGFQDQIQSYEQRYESLKNEKENELNRLQRRNELLSETVARLTNINQESTPKKSLHTNITNNNVNAMSFVARSMSHTNMNTVDNSINNNNNNNASTLVFPTIEKNPSNSSNGNVSLSSKIEEKKRIFTIVTVPPPLADTTSDIDKQLQHQSSSSSASSPIITPGHRSAMNQQVTSAINKVQDAIDRRKMKALETEMNSINSHVAHKDELNITDTLKLLRADIITSPRMDDMNANTIEPRSPSVFSESNNDANPSFSQKLRDTIRTTNAQIK